jgi:integrase
MKKFKFTKTVVEKLPYSDKGKQEDYYDTELDGFGVRVSHKTKKYFVRGLIGVKRVRVMIGSASTKSSDTARSEAKIKLGLIESGIDPNEQEREKVRKQQEEQREITIKELVKKYIEQHAMVEKKSWAEDKRCLEKEVVPLWGKRKAKDIRKRDVVALLDELKERAPVMANNTFEKIRKMFNFAVEKDILETTPCLGVKKPTKTEPKDRVLSMEEIATFWNSLDHAAMTDDIRRALKLILTTGQRPGEVIGIHSAEIDGDWWTIPAERSKNGRTHRVFLTASAKKIIGTKSGFIFESPVTGLPQEDGTLRPPQPINVNAVAYAVRRNLKWPMVDDKGHPLLTKSGEQVTTNKIGVDNWTPHDLRRTAATKISELGYTDEIIDAVLNHVKKGVIATYNRNRYDNEKKAALESWEAKLLSIVSEKQAVDNVATD